MSIYQIAVDDEKVREQIQGIINEVFQQEMRCKYGQTNDMLRACIKDLIYSHKDEIIEKVVDRAAREICRKGLPKLLDKMQRGVEG